jgi:hypothetical protein
VILSVVYLLVRRLLQLVVLLGRSEGRKEVEILVLRHELAVLRRRVPRPRHQRRDRLLLAALSRLLPRARWPVFAVTPQAVLRWHPRPGRPPLGLPGGQTGPAADQEDHPGAGVPAGQGEPKLGAPADPG